MKSCQDTSTLEPDTEIEGLSEKPALLLRLIGELNDAPESIDFENRISELPRVPSPQVTYTLEPDTAMEGLSELPALLVRFKDEMNESTSALAG